MLRLVLRRAVHAIPVLLLIYTVTFGLFRLTPGSPFATGTHPLPPQVLAQIEEKYGLDAPWNEQYTSYLSRAVTGDLGPSYAERGRPVADIIASALPVSLGLAIAAMVLGIIVGLPMGVIAALRRNSLADYVLSGLSTLGVAVPSYVLVTLLIVVLGVYADLLPTQGWDGLFSRTAVIPVAALAVEPAALVARFTRASTLEVLHQDYVRAARARGLRERSVLGRYVLRNALVPIVTIGGLEFASLVGGSFIVETVTNVPGLGRAAVKALVARDYPVIMGTVLLFAVVIVVVSTVVDLLYLVVDPRQRTAR